MELITQIFRALANRQRIRILRLLAVIGEMRVTHIAEATKLDITLVSAHLKVLGAAGLVWKRRSGGGVHYYLPGHFACAVAEEASRLLVRIFRGVREMTPERVAESDRRSSETDSDAALFACFTAFTHPRRLQIIRYLSQRGTAGLVELAAELSMSQRACLRHLAKLERRGFAARAAAGHRTAYSLSDGHGQMQQGLFAAVRGHLGAEDV